MREKRVYLKRIVLSIMMCIAVVVFLMSMKEVKATTTSPSIDTSKTGNITIHKYTKGSTSGVAGTGSSSDATTIPEGALPLENVQFTLYKVNDVSVEDYYYGLQEVSNPAITVEGLYTDSTDGEGNPIKIPDVSKLTLVVQNDSGEDIVNPGKTNNSGELLFSKLPLGIYLVVETSYPDEVTSPADPFLVSLPLTITTNENGSQWLYDVHVYPKNSTTAGVTLQKTGNDGIGLGGVKFNLQKYNITTSKWETIEATLENDSKATMLVTSSEDSTLGQITIKGLDAGEYRFVETDIGNNVGYIMDGKTTYEFTVNANATIDYLTQQGQKSVTITVKNEKPDITKQVKIDGTDSYANWADYSAGDTVDYQVQIKVPSNITSLKKFQVVDTPTGLTDITDDGEIILKVEDGGALVETTAYSIVKAPADGFTINFVPGQMSAYADETLILSYSATLKSTPNIGKNGNPNEIQLIYNNQILPSADEVAAGNPNTAEDPSANPDTLSANIIQDGTIVFSFQIGVDKTDESGTPLNGAEFDLYKQVAIGTDGALGDSDASALGLSEEDGKAWLKINTNKLVTDTIEGVNGKIKVQGLENGTYAFVETKAPVKDGKTYNLLSNAVEAVVKFDYSDTTKDISIDGNKIIKNNIAVSVKKGKTNVDTTEIEETITILNRAGFVLPTTGGAGGFLFTLIGCTVMIVGFILFRKTKEKNADAC